MQSLQQPLATTTNCSRLDGPDHDQSKVYIYLAKDGSHPLLNNREFRMRQNRSCLRFPCTRASLKKSGKVRRQDKTTPQTPQKTQASTKKNYKALRVGSTPNATYMGLCDNCIKIYMTFLCLFDRRNSSIIMNDCGWSKRRRP